MNSITEQFVTGFMQRRVIATMGIEHAAKYSPSWYVNCLIEGHRRAEISGIGNTAHYQQTLIIKDDLANNREAVEKLIAGILGLM